MIKYNFFIDISPADNLHGTFLSIVRVVGYINLKTMISKVFTVKYGYNELMYSEESGTVKYIFPREHALPYFLPWMP